MTPKHAYDNCPALPIAAVGGAFSFAFQRQLSRSAVCAVLPTKSAAHEIHNMNALNTFNQKRVHIMNFLVANQHLSREIHIMNFMNSKQVAEPVTCWRPAGAGRARVPSTNKGARNVMS